jgi:RNA 2',3'-cyclic 3'-phosphodiesterase
VRLFVALDFPEEVRRALGEWIARLKSECRGARWVRPEAMHITLKFIGVTDADKVGAICTALAPIASPEPVDMQFRGLGFFPNERRPRVLWCGVEASRNLPELAAAVERACESLGIQRESRDFVPHLTLARLPSAERSDALIRAANDLKSYDFGRARETEFHLYESVLQSSGAEYKRLASFPFVKDAAARGSM